MLRAFGAHLRHNLIAYVALFLLLGGTAYAASKVKAGDLAKIRVRQSKASVAQGAAVTHPTKCRSGERALSGGMKWDGNQFTGNLVQVQGNLQPVKQPTKYTATGRVNSGGARTLSVSVVCLTD
jgi:hypothetical protein